MRSFWGALADDVDGALKQPQTTRKNTMKRKMNLLKLHVHLMRLNKKRRYQCSGHTSGLNCTIDG
jgi:hypothetical protein